MPSGSKKDIMPSFEAITPIPASMDMEIVRGFRLGLVRKEEAFDGVRSEEDKVGLLSEDGKERDAIVIAIGAIQRREEKRRDLREDKLNTLLIFFFFFHSNLIIYLYTPIYSSNYITQLFYFPFAHRTLEFHSFVNQALVLNTRLVYH